MWIFAAAILPRIAQGTDPASFAFESLIERARKLAAGEYHSPAPSLPAALEDLTYDQLRDIRFRPDHALWRAEGLPFQAQFFHLGFLYKDPVRVHLIGPGGEVSEVAYEPALFDYGKNHFPEPLPADLGFAGFRIHAPLNRADYFDEVAVFLGASYFRLIGSGQVYGLSARGLAIDTALPEGEEFPRFSEFWMEKPARNASSLVIYALLESKSVAGAYRFVLQPGADSVVDVDARLFVREAVEKLGVAPLTSMFLHGENRTRYFPDFRPEVHDSDGLIVATTNGEWVWRPLENPVASLRVNRFQASDVLGFGLFQRDRDFRSYQDLEQHSERRPSFWIEPQGKWGNGWVELVELPTVEEINDNVVAYWVPEKAVAAGDALAFRYRLHAVLDDSKWPPLARAVATRIHPGYEGHAARFVIDFAGPWPPDLRDSDPVSAAVGAVHGKIDNVVVQKNPETGGWRVFFDLEADEAGPSDLRAALRVGPRVLSETWLYQWVSP